MNRSLRVEWWKFRRSRVVFVATALMTVLLPAMAVGIYSIADADVSGPLASKASGFLIGEGWEAYLGVVGQIAAAAVFVGAGVVATWVFGREHVDRTFPALFALPVPRRSIALAKFGVLAVWIVVLTLLIVLFSLGAGVMAGVASLETGEVFGGLGRLAFVVGATALLATTAGYVASVGRGYLPAIGAIVVLVAITQISVLFGVGAWFPYSVPGLVAVGAPNVSVLQILLVPALVLGVVGLTIVWWQRAEVV